MEMGPVVWEWYQWYRMYGNEEIVCCVVMKRDLCMYIMNFKSQMSLAISVYVLNL